MFTLTVERQDGKRLTLTQSRSAYRVKYSGLGPVGADIITGALGMVDGEKAVVKAWGVDPETL